MPAFEIPAIEKSYLKVYGTYGVFDTPNSNYTVRVFSTFASKSKSYDLLKELKPMRERIISSQIKDLGSLLQRDLNDNRVANNLVPYLLGQIANPIAFFPPVLGVLMPKEFINSENDGRYPIADIPRLQGSSKIYGWEEKWFLELFLDGKGSETSLGMLNIDVDQTEIVVIDGQHRANAFRVATNTFPDREKSTYRPFYENVNVGPDFDCDLPVTIIWFENNHGKGIDPNLISRRLFIDVNNSAKSVSNSRKILLNDRDPVALLTRFFYSRIAENRGFKADVFSLLHSAFDSDSDISSGESHDITITTPEIIYDVFDKIFFRFAHYNKLNVYQVTRNSNRYDLSRFEQYFEEFRPHIYSAGDDDESQRLILEEHKIDEFKDSFYKKYVDSFIYLFDSFNLFSTHFKSASILGRKREEAIGDWSSEQRQDVWDKVFCGGEGLYYSYKSIKTKSESLKYINNTIGNIEIEFKKTRFDLHSNGQINIDQTKIDKAYQSLNSKAFQIGYFMAFMEFFEKNSKNDIIKSHIDYINKLNEYSIESWIYIFTDLKSSLIGDADPKSWPAYHKLILRLIQSDSDKRLRFFLDCKDNSPEVQIYRKKMESWVKTHLDSRGLVDNPENYIYIDENEFNRHSNDIINSIQELFRQCGIKFMDGMPEIFGVINSVFRTKK